MSRQLSIFAAKSVPHVRANATRRQQDRERKLARLAMMIAELAAAAAAAAAAH